MTEANREIKWETDSETRDYFEPKAQPENGTFELALVLGGTVSAGAYTGGVLDFLIEALDNWAKAVADGDAFAPRHKVVLKVITGTSGGSINAAIAARAMAFRYPPVNHTTDAATALGNPFYNTWVNQLGLIPFLGLSDLKTPPTPSLFCGTPIDEGAAKIVAFTGDRRDRSRWLADPLTTILTVTNLRGIPYETPMSPTQKPGDRQIGETFVNHADYGRFALVYSDAGRAKAVRKDSFVAGFNPALPGNDGWDTLSEYAKGSSAFPAGFPPRDLSRPLIHYKYRVSLIPSAAAKEPDVAAPLVPDWTKLLQKGETLDRAGYDFPVVDGGCADNEPIELARVALSGLGVRNPRDAMKAKRAILLVDPFGGTTGTGPDKIAGLTHAIGPLIQGMIQQTRYDSQDILLALRDDVYSRFMLSAERPSPTGEQWYGNPALAGAGLGAFIGFASETFRRHDYLLGRRNCQAFLSKHFVLPIGAEAFDGHWDHIVFDAMDSPEAIRPDQGYRPIIPLFGSAAVEEPLPDWPVDTIKLETLRGAIRSRIAAFIVGVSGLSGWKRWAIRAMAALLKCWLANLAIDALRKALEEAKLLTPTRPPTRQQ